MEPVLVCRRMHRVEAVGLMSQYELELLLSGMSETHELYPVTVKRLHQMNKLEAKKRESSSARLRRQTDRIRLANLLDKERKRVEAHEELLKSLSRKGNQ